jgi:shikimate kinase
MKWVIIGHRGVGKSNLLSRWKKYVGLTHETMRFFDLDREIETELGISITEYFIENSERAFREVEQKVFSRIYSEHSQFVMSLGAGFQIASLPKDVRILWYRKKTDADGRIF